MPFRSVLTTCCTLVPVLTTVATAPNTGSPCGSVTVPERLPPAPAHRLQPSAARANPAETQDLDLKVMSHSSYPALLPATTLPIIRCPKYLKPKAENWSQYAKFGELWKQPGVDIPAIRSTGAPASRGTQPPASASSNRRCN